MADAEQAVVDLEGFDIGCLEGIEHEVGGETAVFGYVPETQPLLVAAGDDADRQLLLDASQVQVVLSEKHRAGGIVVEVQAMAGASKVGQRR